MPNPLYRVVSKVVLLLLCIGSILPNTGAQSLPNKPGNKSFLRDTLPLQGVPAPLVTGARQSATTSGRSMAAVCNTTTFKLRIPVAAGEKIEIAKLQTFPNGNFLVAGTLTLVNGTKEGLLMVLMNNGAVLQQKRLQIDNKPITLSTAVVDLNGDVYIAGIFTDGTKAAFFSRLKADLSTVYVKTIEQPALPSKITLTIADGIDLAIAVQSNSNIIYSSWNKNGGLQWFKQLTTANQNQLVDFGMLSYTKLGIITNCQYNGKPMIQVFDINQYDGSLQASGIEGNGNEENRCMATTTFNARLSMLGISVNAGSTYDGFRNNIASSVNSETVHKYQLPVTLDPSVSAAMDNAGDALAYFLPASGQLIFIKHFAYYTTKPEFCRQYTVPAASSVASIARSFDGGFLFGLNTTTADQFILIKTDSIGTLPVCGFQTLSINSTENILAPNTPVTATTGNASYTGNTASTTGVPTAYNTVFDCQQLYCPTDPLEDLCLSTYYKTFRSPSYVETIVTHHLMRNDNQLIATRRSDRILGGQNQITCGLKLLNEKGQLQKAVTVFNDTASQAFNCIQVNDHQVMLIINASSNNTGKTSLTLVDDNLQIVWSKTIVSGNDFYSGGMGVADLHQDAEGNFYVMGNNLAWQEKPKVYIQKMDASGNELWTKYIEIDANLNQLMGSLTSTASSLIVEVEATNGESFRLDKATGQILNSYLFARNSDGSVFRRMFKYDNGHIFYAGSSPNGQLLVAMFDTTAKPLQMKYLDASSSIMRSATVKDGFMYVMYNFYNGTGFKEGMVKLDTLLNTIFMNGYDLERNRLTRGLSVSDGGYIYSGGNFSYGGSNTSYLDPYIIKYNQQGEMGTCVATPLTDRFIDIPLNIQPLSCTLFPRTYARENYVVNFYPDITDLHTGAILCSSAPQCTFIDVKDPGPVCQLNTDYAIPYSKDANCTVIPKWVYDASIATLQKITDTSAIFRFKKTGSLWIKAILDQGCSIYKDSIQLQVQASLFSLSLGKDTVFCPGDSILLKAGAGFSQYLWQDGSVNTDLKVKQAGKYYVQVTNACGDHFADTIYISQGIVPPLSLGQDVQACIKDSVDLQASPGFAKYNWQPVAWIAGQTAQAKIAPPRDTTVIVQGITTDGCPASDTLLISLKAARPVYLGKDTSFCQADSLTLQAGSGYQQYQWSTGSVASTLTVHQAGTYYVQAKDVNGCFARDTLTVISTFATPVVSLGANRDLCTGDKLLLDAGNFSTYQWQDGSVNRTYTASGTGSYWVRVTDKNHCTGKDTIDILKINPLPTGFLKSVDSLCRYGKLTIVPAATYRTYDWSTGTTSSTAIVTKPGIYTLAVTDNSGCIGKDTIVIVQKDCLFGFFIPNSFSPNGDYRNDAFKALLYGPVLKFKLQVYNRYGELIFGTTDPGKAWDGTWKGKPCDNGNYVWQCSYQLEGGEPVYKKGIVILVH